MSYKEIIVGVNEVEHFTVVEQAGRMAFLYGDGERGTAHEGLLCTIPTSADVRFVLRVHGSASVRVTGGACTWTQNERTTREDLPLDPEGSIELTVMGERLSQGWSGKVKVEGVFGATGVGGLGSLDIIPPPPPPRPSIRDF